MKIEIQVTATEVTELDKRTRKMFAARIEDSDRNYYYKPGWITEVEERLIEAIAQRIKYDREHLIEWHTLPGSVTATIKIIPAIDYQPQNQ